jgi:hypothetical protein
VPRRTLPRLDGLKYEAKVAELTELAGDDPSAMQLALVDEAARISLFLRQIDFMRGAIIPAERLKYSERYVALLQLIARERAAGERNASPAEARRLHRKLPNGSAPADLAALFSE